MKVLIRYRPEWTREGWILFRRVNGGPDAPEMRPGSTVRVAVYPTSKDVIAAIDVNVKADRAAATRLGVEVEHANGDVR
jgi:hypothetical protein